MVFSKLLPLRINYSFLSNKKTVVFLKYLLRSKPKATWSVRAGPEVTRRKHLTLRSPAINPLFPIPPNSHWVQSLQQIPKLCEQGQLPSLALVSWGLPLLLWRSGPSSFSLNHVWPQLYFPNFPQRPKAEPCLPDCHRLCVAMLKNTAWSLQLARTFPRNAVILLRESQHFIKFESRETELLWQESRPAIMRKGKGQLLQDYDWFLKDAFIVLKTAKTRICSIWTKTFMIWRMREVTIL